MKLHARTIHVEQVRAELGMIVSQFLLRTDLTTAEAIGVVSAVMGREVTAMTNQLLRIERHGNTDTPADEAGDDEADEPLPEPTCASCGRPRTPFHDADAPGPTVRHFFKPAPPATGA